ncbi:MAG TPA: tetratricopeptide repeat protein [Pyrinomonadaceae bacterium]|nr:tetratricopeptide repeat protein [Pyrinomonadaceae bacterium]
MTDAKRKSLPLLCAAACFALCCGAAWFSVRAGLSRLLTETAPALRFAGAGREAARLAEEAAALSPLDPEARLARALALAAAGDTRGAVGESERAASLRPGYYLSWLRLGRAREQAGDAEGAAAAYREAARLAPAYAEPRWQLGNMLLRGGRYEEAFAELRRAAASRPALFPYTAELAWRVYGEDARAVAEAVGPSDDAARVALARFFARRGKGTEAVEQFRVAGPAAGETERRELVAELISVRRFREAYEVWSEDAGGAGAGGVGSVIDGGFEGRAVAARQGFGWRFARDAAGVSASLDVTGPREGARSLLLEFGGAPDANARLASQLVIVEPGARYRLGFAARAEKLVSGGPLLVAVVEAGEEGRTLAESQPLPADTGGWADLAFEFEVPPQSDAVVVVIRRRPCPAAPCPVFGRAWFDAFSLGRVG